MLAIFYYPQCILLCCSRFVQLYLESICLLPIKLKSIWNFILISIPAFFSLGIGLLHINFVFIERIFFSWAMKPQNKLMVYIIGAPRSGTTRLHKLLAADKNQFTTMKMWELFFAPALIQKKALHLLGKIDSALFKNRISNSIQKAEKLLFNKFNDIHSLSLFNVEEDALVLFHLFYTYHLSFLLGTEESYANLNRNKNVPKSVWIYYKYCIENHQMQNATKIYLAKNPFLSSHSQSLETLFPLVRFINITRNIKEVAPSFFSMKKYLSNVFYSTNPSENKYKEILEILKYWQKCGTELKETEAIQVDYLDLKKQPSLVIDKLYTFLNIDLTLTQQKVLLLEDEKSKNYKSNHKYMPGEFLEQYS